MEINKKVLASLVIPVYGSQDLLPTLLTKIKEAFNHSQISIYSYEIIFVCDSSPDNSWQIIKDLSIINSQVRGILLRTNAGQHNAIMAGLEEAKGEIIITMDDDLQHSPDDISKLIDHTLRCGKIEISEFFLEKDNSILQNDEMMSEIFKKHCDKKNIQMIQYLLEKDNNLIKKNMKFIKRYSNNENIMKEFLIYYPDMFKDFIIEEEIKDRLERQEDIDEGNDVDDDEIYQMRSNLFIDHCRDGFFNTLKLIYEHYPDVIKYNWAIVWTCTSGHMEIAKWLYEKRQDYPMFIWEFAFMWSCMNGELDIIKWIYSVKPNININADCGDNDDGGFENSDVNGFTMACTSGELDVAKWLLEINPIETLSGIDEFNTFAYVCKQQKFTNDIEGNSYDPILILKWLIEIKPEMNISENNEMAFYYACTFDNIETAKWLLEIKPDINISIMNDYIFRQSSHNIEIM
jgi:glycosyltransferase involved in cell wall biosynthesis